MNFKPYPFLRYLFLLISGITLNEYTAVRPVWPLVGLAVSVTVFAWAFIIKKQRLLKAGLFSGILIFGWWTAGIHNERLAPDHFLHQAAFSDYMVSVCSGTETKPRSYKCTGEIRAVNIRGKWEPVKGKTLLYFAKTSHTAPSFGDIFIIKGRPRLIEPPKNAFEFDYRKYQERRNIFTHHFLREGDFIYAGHKTIHPLFEWANKLNQYSDACFKKYLETTREVGVAEALIAGMRSELDYEIINAYSVSGAIHVLSVSGMHVGILFLVLSWLAGVILPRNSKNLWPTVVLITLLWFYALYTGLSPSVCRATLMFSLIQTGYALRRESNTYNIVAFSAFILLLINPAWLFDVGFQLSYLAVLGIIMLYAPIRNLVEIKNKALRWLWEISVVSFVAQLFTFPLGIYYFHQFPTYFLFSNPGVAILATPILPLGLLLIVLSPFPYLAGILGWMLKYLIVFLNDFVVFTATLPFASLNGFSMTVPGLILFYLIIACFVWFFMRSDIRALKMATGFIAMICLMKAIKISRYNRQHELTFHYFPNSSGLSIIEGRQTKLIAPDSVLGDPMIYQFHLKNYYDHRGIHRVSQHSPGSRGVCHISGKAFEVMWIYKEGQKVTTQAPFLLISANAVKDLRPFRGYEGRIILDGSNKKWIVERLKEQAAAFNMDLISVYDRGSVTYALNDSGTGADK